MLVPVDLGAMILLKRLHVFSTACNLVADRSRNCAYLNSARFSRRSYGNASKMGGFLFGDSIVFILKDPCVCV